MEIAIHIYFFFSLFGIQVIVFVFVFVEIAIPIYFFFSLIGIQVKVFVFVFVEISIYIYFFFSLIGIQVKVFVFVFVKISIYIYFFFSLFGIQVFVLSDEVKKMSNNWVPMVAPLELIIRPLRSNLNTEITLLLLPTHTGLTYGYFGPDRPSRVWTSFG